MEAFLVSTSTVALAEIGDKTQLLSLFLAARFRKPIPIIFGILVATLLNHGLSAWLGVWLTEFISPQTGRLLVGISFIAVALWILIPDKEEDAASNIKPSKKRSSEKIDGVVSLIMSLGSYMTEGDISSVYNDRGLLIL